MQPKMYFSFLMTVLLLPLTASGGESTDQALQTGEARPNILILMAEDMSGRVGAFGDPVAVTPNLDRLAESSVRFPNTFTTAGVCAPSRAAQITGMHQASFGAQHMRTRSFEPTPYRSVPAPDVKAYPELLRKAGYYTFTNNKLDYQFSNTAAGSGPFTIWDYEGRAPDWRRRKPGQPFFGLINFNITHESQLFGKNVDKNRANGLARVVEPGEVEVPPYYPDTRLARETIAQHYDNIFEMDKQVGELLSKLKSDGLLDNTIVIWTTDHGDGLPRAKREIYDSGIKVPLILHWPASLRLYPAAAGSVDARLVSFVDFAPSVLSWAGVAIPGFIQGRPTLSDPAEERAFIYAAKDRLDEFPFRERAVRDGRFKYIFNYQPGRPGAQHIAYRDQMDMMAELWASYGAGKMSDEQKFWFDPRPQEELYDLQVDPHEVHNLADNSQYKGQLERMRKALAVWRERVKDHSDQPEAEMALEFWPDGKQPLTAPPTISLDGNRVTLACDSTGASIGYRIGKNSWQVYSGPFEWPTGLRLEAKAVRYGWQESEVAVLLPDATNEGN